MKTVQELRSALKDLFDSATEQSESDAQNSAPQNKHAETTALHEQVIRKLNEIIRSTLDKNVLYCVPNDDFYIAIKQLMTDPLFTVCTTYEIAPDVTDEQILAHREDIEQGNLSALESLRKMPSEKTCNISMDEEYWKRRQLLNNLAYYFYVMAHLAKHYESRSAAQNYLRAASIARKGLKRLPMNLSEDAIDELVSLAQESDDELMVAADYYALSDWEPFRAKEAEKLAAEEAKLTEKAD